LVGAVVTLVALAVLLLAVLSMLGVGEELGALRVPISGVEGGVGVLLGAGTLLIFGAFALWMGLSRTEDPNKRVRRLSKTGHKVKARVLSYRDTGGSRGSARDPAVSFVLEIELPDQPTYQLTVRDYVPRLLVPRLHEMTHLRVLVDAEDHEDLEIVWDEPRPVARGGA